MLGPLLFFLLYMKDICNTTSNTLSILFADITNLFYMTVTNLKELAQKFNQEFIEISKWLKVNKLSLNIDKHITKYRT